MKVSLNWLQQYIDTGSLSPEEIGDILTSTGLEVEGMEEIESIPGGLKGLVVGEVKECGKHPGADKLSVTMVDVGHEELLPIVCGAPNVSAGQKVVVATVNTVLYPAEGEPFKIKKSKIRGEVSEGMICAEDEIGLGQSHDGIMVLPAETPVGMPAREYFKVEKDFVYDIGLTPNRSDATNHLGVALDLAAALHINHNTTADVNKPDVSAFKVANNSMPVPVKVNNTEACPRYTGVTISGVKIGESPDWLKKRLQAIGVRPISNVVDITNFVLHELGQPLHAFDYDKISGHKIIVDTLPEQSKFLSLDEQERSLNSGDLMICDGENKGMCIAGVFGGFNSGVTDATTNIFLESAHFDAEWIRRTSMRHNLRSDAAKVFEKGSDPNNTVYALKRAILLIQELAGGTITSEVVDIYPTPKQPVEIAVLYKRINRLIGVEIAPAQVHRILEAMEMEIKTSNAEGFTVAIPTNKSDVLREVDVIEEILRIYGFNNVPIPTRVTTSMAIGRNPDPTAIRNTISDMLANQGFLEAMALSLSESRYYEEDESLATAGELVFINNTSNTHLDVMRPSMLYSGLEAIQRNQNRQISDLNLFEFGRTYLKKEDEFEETDRLSLFLTGKRHPENWHSDDQNMVSFYMLKAVVQNVLNKLGISGYQVSTLSDKAPFSFGTYFHRGPKVLVEFGQVNKSYLSKLDIKNPVFFADFNWNNVFSAIPKKRVQFTSLNKYPTMRRDLALIVDNSTKFSDIASIAAKTGKKLLKETNLFDVYADDDKLGAGKKSYAVSFFFENPERTLKVKEVDKIMQELIRQYETQLSALIRR